MNAVLYYLRDIGLLQDVPAKPTPKQILARSVCFLHDEADNPKAFLLFHDGYVCDTKGCHKDRRFGNNLEGLIRQMAYRLTDQIMSWSQAWSFARRNKADFKGLVGDKACSGSASPKRERPIWTAATLAACLKTPCPYFLSRGFRPETLAHFGIGMCIKPLPDGRRLHGWSVVPVLDGYQQIPFGYTARNPRFDSTPESIKWFHGVSKGQILFNSFPASRSPGPFIICEGIPSVLRFHEAGFTGAVATLGGALSESQYPIFLGMYSNQDVLIAADNDANGRGQQFAAETRARIKGICLREPRIVVPPNGRKDFGDCSVEEIAAMRVPSTDGAAGDELTRG